MRQPNLRDQNLRAYRERRSGAKSEHRGRVDELYLFKNPHKKGVRTDRKGPIGARDRVFDAANFGRDLRIRDADGHKARQGGLRKRSGLQNRAGSARWIFGLKIPANTRLHGLREREERF